MEDTEMLRKNSPFNLEFRNIEDDAWYTARVDLSLGNVNEETNLTVKFEGFADGSDFKFSVGRFRTVAEVDEFVKRFRPLSEQFQDRECHKITKGTRVCAALSCYGDDLRYFDAVVEGVNKQEHKLTNGEEECTCTFVLVWLHGPSSGNLTTTGIANICSMKSATGKVDPDITSFAKLAKQRIDIVSSHCSSASRKPASSEESGSASKSGVKLQIVLRSNGKICRSTGQSDSDKDLGGENSMHQHVASIDGLHIVLINNLETNLSPLIIEQFIHRHTSIIPKVLVFPSQSPFPYASGAICLGSETKLEKIFRFLTNPDHMIISARGRYQLINDLLVVVMFNGLAGPWIITGKMFWHRTLGSAVHILEYEYEGKFWKSNMSRELKVVHLGTEAYKKATQLRELFMDFMDHINRIHNRLAFEEAKILQ